MTANICALIAQCAWGKQPEDHLFTRPDGKPVRDFRKAWQNLCITAGLGEMVEGKYQGPIFHDTRRTAARNFRRAGVAEGVIMRVGGWRTRSVFERYNIVSQADITDALLKLEQAQRATSLEFGHDFGHDRPAGDSNTKVARAN